MPTAPRPHFRDNEDIKAELRRRGWNLAKLSRETGVPHSTLKMSFFAKACPKGDFVIAEVLGLSVHQVWPDRYDPQGRRIFDRSQSKPSKEVAQRLKARGR